MSDRETTVLPRAGAGGAARRHAGFQRRADFPGGRGAAAAGRCRARGYPRPRLRDHPRARSRQRGGRARGPACSSDDELLEGPAPHDDLARLRCAHADGAAPGQDLVLHAAHGRGGGELRLPQGARARRHELPDLSPGRAADRRRLSDARHDEPDLLQRARSAEGPPAAGDVLVARARLLLDLGQSRHAVHPGGRLGDGVGDEARHQDRRRLDRRRLDRRIGFPRRPGLRLDLQGAGRAQHRQQSVGDLDLPGHRPRRLGHLRRARPGLRHSGAARRRQRLSRRLCRGEMGGRAGAPQSRADPGRVRDLSRRRAFDVGRSLGLPAEDGVRRLAAGRSRAAPEEAPDPARRLVGGTPQAGRGRDPGRRSSPSRRRPRRHGTLHSGPHPSARDMFEGVYEEMPPHLRRQRQQGGI